MSAQRAHNSKWGKKLLLQHNLSVCKVVYKQTHTLTHNTSCKQTGRQASKQANKMFQNNSIQFIKIEFREEAGKNEKWKEIENK